MLFYKPGYKTCYEECSSSMEREEHDLKTMIIKEENSRQTEEKKCLFKQIKLDNFIINLKRREGKKLLIAISNVNEVKSPILDFALASRRFVKTVHAVVQLALSNSDPRENGYSSFEINMDNVSFDFAYIVVVILKDADTRCLLLTGQKAISC